MKHKDFEQSFSNIADKPQWYRFKEARCILNKNGEESIEDVAAACEISRGVIGNLENKSLNPYNAKIDAVKKLAIHYGVSIDYLLCVDNTQQISPDVKAASKLTGLSGKAIDVLSRLSSPFSLKSDSVEDKDLPVLNKMITTSQNLTVDFINRVFEDCYSKVRENTTKKATHTIFELMEEYVRSNEIVFIRPGTHEPLTIIDINRIDGWFEEQPIAPLYQQNIKYQIDQELLRLYKECSGAIKESEAK